MDLKYIEDVYNHEFIKPLKLCFKILSRSYISFYDPNPSKFKNWKYVIVFPSIILYNMTLMAYIIRAISINKDVVDLALAAPVYIITVQAVYRAFTIVLKKSQIIKLIDALGSMWRTTGLTETQVKIKTDMLKKIEFAQRAYYITSNISSTLFTFLALAETLLRKLILQQDSELLLPFHCIFPFDPTKTYFRYIMVYIFEAFGIYQSIFAYLSSEFLMTALCSHLITEFALLREDLVNLRPNKDIKNNLQIEEQTEEHSGMDIKDIIKRHQKLITLSKDLDDIYNKMNFLVLLFATIINSFLAFAATVTTGSSMLIYYIGVVAMFTPLFIMCYFGELLAQESAGIAEAAYENLWYEGGKNYQKTICIILARSQRPCCLTSLKYAPINMTTFSKLLSTTWSYFTLINSMYEDV